MATLNMHISLLFSNNNKTRKFYHIKVEGRKKQKQQKYSNPICQSMASHSLTFDTRKNKTG